MQKTVIFACALMFFVLTSCNPSYLTHTEDRGTEANTLKASPFGVPGNLYRCSEGKYDIYDQTYDRSLEIFKRIFSKFDANNQIKPSVQNPLAKKLLIKSRRMLLNMMNDNEPGNLPYNSIHPAAFFATIKDFESSDDYRWSNTDFGIKTLNCGSHYCYGPFQLSLDIEPLWDKYGLCGASGLDVLTIPGGLDFCASLFWWTIAEGGQKCHYMKDVAPGENSKPHYINERFCNKQLSKAVNVCSEPYEWSVDTFSYGYYCAYVQHNQYAHHGIHDSWGKLYTGFKLDNSQIQYGYQGCAIYKYLKKLKYKRLCIANGNNFTLDNLHPSQNLIRAAIADFACNINLLPSWVDKKDCVNPKIITSTDPKCSSGELVLEKEAIINQQLSTTSSYSDYQRLNYEQLKSAKISRNNQRIYNAKHR